MRRVGLRSSLIFAFIVSVPAVACAHAFGQQYSLPLPFRFYGAGAALALLASFAFLGFFQSAVRERAERFVRLPAFYKVSSYFRPLAISIFLVVLSIAFLGPQDFMSNPVPDLFWSVFLLLGVYLSAFVGGWWPYADPFGAIARLFVRDREAMMIFPEWLKFLPVILTYYGLVWFELLSFGAGAEPFFIGIFLCLYAILFCTGAELFGVGAWSIWGDLFQVMFSIVGRMAPVTLEEGGIRLRAPLERLVRESATHFLELFFILCLLASTAFDGLQETPIWWQFFFDPVKIRPDSFNMGYSMILASFPFAFLALYGACVYVMMRLTRTKGRFRYFLLRFGNTLIPIAIAYSFAHYFTLPISALERIVITASDPLGLSWDLFGTARMQPSTFPIGADVIWNVQLVVIVAGHIAATYVAHRIAVMEFPRRRDAVIGQVPMLFLMVAYTVFGLWILSQSY